MKQPFFSSHKDKIRNEPVSHVDSSNSNKPNNSFETSFENKDILTSLFHDHATIMLLINPETGEIIYANNAAVQFYGFDFQEDEKIHVQDINIAPASIISQELQKTQKFRTNYFILNHKTAHGIIRTVEVHSSPVILKGSKFLYSIIHDVTERILTDNDLRMNENMLKMILETTPNAVMVTDQTQDKILYTNKRFWEIWPELNREEFLNYTASAAIDKLSQSIINHECFFDQSPHGQENRLIIEKTIQLYNGKYYKCHIYFIPGDESKYERKLFIIKDITAEELYTISLQTAVKKEKENNELKSSIVRMTSHEFKTPLTSILMATETLQRYDKNKDQIDYSKLCYRIKKNIHKMQDIVDKNLNLSNLDSGKIPINLEKTDLVSFMQRWLDEFKAENLSDHKIKLVSNCHNCHLFIDTGYMAQVLNNLVVNGIKYSPEKSTIEISLVKTSIIVRIHVRDEGIGIPFQDQEYIFTTSFRASNVDHVSGTGIGLSMSRQIIELHGGKIGFKSQLNEGTTFTIELPCVD